MRLFKGFLAVMAVGIALAGSVKAESITASFMGVTPNGPNFDFTYTINLTTGMTVNSTPVADFFQIVDVIGLVGAAWSPVSPAADWTLGTVGQNSVPSNGGPPLVYAPDSVTIPNVLVTYIGAPGITNGLLVDLPLGILVITSDSGQVKKGWIVGSDTQLGSPNLNGSNFTDCPVPVPTPAAAWAGLGLFALLAARKAMR